MTKEEFKKDALDGAKKMIALHPDLRLGQSVFNYIETKYKDTAYFVKQENGVDCFYNDNIINLFLDYCWEIVKTK